MSVLIASAHVDPGATITAKRAMSGSVVLTVTDTGLDVMLICADDEAVRVRDALSAALATEPPTVAPS